ncbi:hypothetical protein DPMN_083650 [Dreissena polymorpha]|uniref:TIR domain-containing protein n=2 Tax=Dreissena polymorpha TaxID=45954 RepID=A0A9D3Y9P9_DREPO|nr:hypothetical protein DPMN_083650 [Dreissena polymorpha]
MVCVCPPGKCDNLTSSEILTSPPSTAVNIKSTLSSIGNCNCIYGTCLSDATTKCLCNKGWFGNTCNMSCSQLCGASMLCIDVNGSVQCIPDSVNDSPVHHQIPDVCSPTYVKRSESERSCRGSFVICEFGVCIEKTEGVRCECDHGATGTLCEHSCCRGCGTHGACRVVPENGLNVCDCERNYTGNKCDAPIDVSNSLCSCVHGACNGPGTCSCYEGWTGGTCNISCTEHCGTGRQCIPFLFGKVYCFPNGNETTTQSPPISPRLDACSSDYVIRSESERSCKGMFSCKYGTCVTNDPLLYCRCDLGVSPSQLCEHKCCKDCGNQGQCYYHVERQEERCNCDTNYTGSLCEIYDPPVKYIEPEKVKWWFYLLVILIPILVMTLLTSLFLMYLWKRRVIVVLKAVRLFQAYEDDDERQWDAFISYRSNTPDEDYVIHTLFPKLTREMGFNVNVHYKDFIPGNEITNNIIYAVENSRRTILVVSPHYLTSNFTKMEWQLAQQKMLERKNKIIPILLEDISPHKDTIDPNLKSILDSVTYIEWPGDQSKKIDKFWQRLNLSMPKKKKQPSSHMNSSFQNGRLSQPTNSTNQNSDSFNKSFELESMKPMYASSVSESSEVYNHVNEDEMLAPDEIYNIINEGAIDLDFKHVTGEQTRTEINNDRNAGNRPKAMLNVSKRIENDYVFKIDV